MASLCIDAYLSSSKTVSHTSISGWACEHVSVLPLTEQFSLDTLDPFKFELMTRRRGHEAVLRSLDVALAHPGLQKLKLNVVVIRGLNDSEVLDFVALTKENSLSVRFIEFMPFTGNFIVSSSQFNLILQ
jgi:hypothetical protein